MQRFATTFRVAFFAALSVASVAPSLGDDRTNLLMNPNIESGKREQPSIWFAAHVPAEGLAMSRDADNAYEGTYSLAIRNSHRYEQQVSNNWMQRLQTVPEGKAIQVSGCIRTKNADAANICLQCWDRSGQIMLAFASTPIFRGDQGWTEVTSQTMLVPENTEKIIVRAALTGVGEAWFDELAVTVIESANPVSHKNNAKLKRPDKTTERTAMASQASREVAAGAEPSSDAQLPKDLLQVAPGAVVGSAPISKDCMILSYLPTWSHGNVDNIAVANNSGGVRTLINWDTTQLKPLTGKSQRFYLALYSRETTAKQNPGEVTLYGIKTEWKERASWQTQPEITSEPISAEKFKSGNGWKLFDVTELVRHPVVGHGVMLRFDMEDKAPQAWSGYAFASREGIGQWQQKRPVLLIVETVDGE